MAFEVASRILSESESTDRRPRPGVIEEVLRGDPSPRHRNRFRRSSRVVMCSLLGVVDPAASASAALAQAAGRRSP